MRAAVSCCRSIARYAVLGQAKNRSPVYLLARFRMRPHEMFRLEAAVRPLGFLILFHLFCHLPLGSAFVPTDPLRQKFPPKEEDCERQHDVEPGPIGNRIDVGNFHQQNNNGDNGEKHNEPNGMNKRTLTDCRRKVGAG